MSKLMEILRNDHIKAALVSGSCIIILAVAAKKFLHVEMTNLETAIPGLIFTMWELARVKIKHHFWSRVLPWNLLMLLATALVILRRLL